ncbi:glycosyltransferase family 2 protein [Christiangramia sp. SM2212]|uniref:Glycosyltransferase family 2 protein n=1 Tax=Christiangramia sediminicola TaxID=3073267 RepID=A0ABU1EMV4_9FLAO|nr:glycosyltransferase family 2 protein [Christiangramia sp. SM2212]MDR5589717.1 glycosyltransferase family 2 protein [Christiangramia sp. SM2212]
MNFSVIICTFQRPAAMDRLMRSITGQSLYPDEILVVDGSKDDDTKILFQSESFLNLKYFHVEPKDRGLTKQRNFGISKAKKDIICFLDDDVVLELEYFKNLIESYEEFRNTIGVGGYITNQVNWKETKRKPTFREFKFDGWIRDMGSRYSFRKIFGLLSDRPPGFMPSFSNGYPISFLPPSGRTYPVEFFMGGVASYKREVFEKLKFSEYFEGYGLYEDMDFCLRVSELGQLYVNTNAKLQHLHDENARPNKYHYGKMVIRNGWYVWRVKFPKPSMQARFKWHSVAFLLLLVRVSNVLNTSQSEEAFFESLGRITGWISLFFKTPE